LVALTDAERENFIRDDVADYTEQLAATEPTSTLETAEQARRDFVLRLRHEHALADADRHRRWTALAADGSSVGWLWVTPADADMPRDSVFLYQILVRPTKRRHGYGRAMLAELEESLKADGIAEVRLNVFDTNQRAKALYEEAGYELLESLEGKSKLRKRFAVNHHAD
jgi:ribosomal protein S18 acetylase RimI-like enzyme